MTRGRERRKQEDRGRGEEETACRDNSRRGTNKCQAVDRTQGLKQAADKEPKGNKKKKLLRLTHKKPARIAP